MKSSSILPRLGILFLLGTSTAASHAGAAVTTFDFESSPATASVSLGNPGADTSLSLTSAGLTTTITRSGGVAFDIYDDPSLAPYGLDFPASWGTRSLDPFYSDTSDSGFIANFSAPVSGVSLDLGDFGGDSDTFTLNAYAGANGTGTLLGTTIVDYGTASLPTFSTATLTASGIQSVTWDDLGVYGGSTYYNSLYYDNLVVTSAVPEPSTWALLGIGAGLLGLTLRRRAACV